MDWHDAATIHGCVKFVSMSSARPTASETLAHGPTGCYMEGTGGNRKWFSLPSVSVTVTFKSVFKVSNRHIA